MAGNEKPRDTRIINRPGRYTYYTVINGTELVLSNKINDMVDKYGRYNKLHNRPRKIDAPVISNPTRVHYMEPLYNYHFEKTSGKFKGAKINGGTLVEIAMALGYKKSRFQACVLGEIPKVSGWEFVPERSYIDPILF